MEFVNYADHVTLDLVVQDMLAKGATELVKGSAGFCQWHSFLKDRASTVSLWRSLLGHLASLDTLGPSSVVLEETLEGSVRPTLMLGSSFTAVSGRSLLVDGSGSSSLGTSLCDGSSGTVSVFRHVPSELGDSFISGA
ncbi:hypothetical protein E2C01_052422 [Portunus trituberculatus]|uniref:Uncharacterized protein n=1 Tax=Portunus trituberculatus TaxID=210409 RepID=A0A5B7GMF1_PORTR|nr:hypothetical protein [Portunus trituberculatus]